MKNMRVGIIGFGTVGTVLADILNNSGIVFSVYDVLMEDPHHKDELLKKAKDHKAPVKSLSTLCEESTYIFSMVTTQVAEDVAKKCLPHLKSHHIYIDCNSTSPGKKINIKNIILSGDSEFVEGVIVNAVHSGDSTLSILTGGEKGQELASFLNMCNIKARFYSNEIGNASMFKMLRSIFSKGLEALLLEMLVSAKKAGIEKDLWKEITTFMDSKSFVEIGESWVKSHASAYERRKHEIEQVISTIQELNVSPIITKATLDFFERSIDVDLKSYFKEPPSTADEVINILAEHGNLQGM